MYKLVELVNGSFRVELNYDSISRMSDSEFSSYFSAGRYTRQTFEMLQRIKELQALDKELPPKKRKLDRIS